jgi:hypothetical protein
LRVLTGTSHADLATLRALTLDFFKLGFLDLALGARDIDFPFPVIRKK